MISSTRYRDAPKYIVHDTALLAAYLYLETLQKCVQKVAMRVDHDLVNARLATQPPLSVAGQGPAEHGKQASGGAHFPAPLPLAVLDGVDVAVGTAEVNCPGWGGGHSAH
jgi:hypothetical protein